MGRFFVCKLKYVLLILSLPSVLIKLTNGYTTIRIERGDIGMSFSKEKRLEINKALVREIAKYNTNPIQTIVDRFGISRQTAHKYLTALMADGTVLTDGKRGKYRIKETEYNFVYSIKGLEEDVVWRQDIFPLLVDLPRNVLHICNYGFTEMLNNAIDHSDAEKVNVFVNVSPISVEFGILDYGIGIFNKIQIALGLEDPKHSILELAKGKLTTDPNRHSGEGIFFTSRVFDEFYIRSGDLQFFSGRESDKDYLVDDLKETKGGTCVIMTISKDSNIVLKEVFDSFTAKADAEFGFSKTHIPVRLVEHEGAMLVSRSQAKRLIRRFDRFMEVLLDFNGVSEIGQAFADELFRVFPLDHPNVELIPINMTDDVKKMVFRAIGNRTNKNVSN